ncbi:anaerobic ribonucleoside-triphosphate reductase activating protein [Tissierella praeacuta DSM 18095]|uniref:Anaerobic ribonucleoside-triphosphate reductase-activating protein n=1 Tax=Tissierella praeacuta DSM 18095 TaxID=1123404 RepID=A0A1M4S4Q1_9FIRM|nr:anaerobic ribonucleoside-triphosphate reductase activating protein [Tissierella praeacuta]SHE27194.1 anaerobic ribonucleoside-triphosphate reductase activating protein [Tissierella praeacuta DSM 18095]SUP00830.1 Pyruvate formate-lyase 1-activating enzyme [Tissierella praeacuta]
MSKIRIAGIEEESIVDGPGIRLVVFTQGCNHNCIGCHNPETHSFYGGKLVDIDNIINMIIENPLLDGITLSGGEPFEQAIECSILAKRVRNMGLNVVTYTGYTFEEILRNDNFRELLLQTDILIDGKFDISKKSMMLQFRGSTNQRIIDVKKYLGL